MKFLKKNYDIFVVTCYIIFYLIFSMPYFETSAATGQNVSKAVDTLLDMVMTRMENTIEQQLVNNNMNCKLTKHPHNGTSSGHNHSKGDYSSSDRCAC